MIDNSAGEFGGLWFIDVRVFQDQKQRFIIQRTTIEKSAAEKSPLLSS